MGMLLSALKDKCELLTEGYKEEQSEASLLEPQSTELLQIISTIKKKTLFQLSTRWTTALSND